MKLTEENKAHIDSLDYEGLLCQWRFAPAGDSIFQGESGKYYKTILAQKRKEVGDAEHVRASKSIG